MAVNKYNFVTGGENGEVSLWNISKRKPQIILNETHQNGWISSLQTIYNSDVVISGASDGKLVFYKGTFDDLKTLKIQSQFDISCPGIVNSIKISPDERFMAVVVGGENQFGRWRVQDVDSRIYLYTLHDN